MACLSCRSNSEETEKCLRKQSIVRLQRPLTPLLPPRKETQTVFRPCQDLLAAARSCTAGSIPTCLPHCRRGPLSPVSLRDCIAASKEPVQPGLRKPNPTEKLGQKSWRCLPGHRACHLLPDSPSKRPHSCHPVPLPAVVNMPHGEPTGR